MRFSTIVQANQISCLACTALASPVEVALIPKTESLKNILTVRQSGSGGDPTDYGSETITPPGQDFTFTQWNGLNITEDDRDIIFELSETLFADLKALRADPDICANATTDLAESGPLKPKKANNLTDSMKKVRDTEKNSKLSERQMVSLDSHLWTVEEDTECYARWTISGMDPNELGLHQLVPINAQAQRLEDYLEGGAVADLTKRLIAFVQYRGYLDYLQPDQIRGLGQAAAAVQVAFDQNAIDVDRKFRVSKQRFGLNTTKSCGTGRDMPTCQDANCRGIQLTCSDSSPNKGCACSPLAIQFAPVWMDFDSFDAQQDAFVKASQTSAAPGTPGTPIGPKCNGIGNPFYANRDYILQDLQDFCTTGISDIKPTGRYTSVSFTDQPFKISQSQCTDLFMTILDGCDGNNPDNPMNWKHGGSIELPGGSSSAVLTISIKNAVPQPYCTDTISYTGPWVDEQTALNMVGEICENHPLWLVGKAGDRQEILSNQYGRFVVDLLFTQNMTLTKEKCYEYLLSPVNNCNGNDPKNPLDHKFGGIFTSTDGVVFRFTPLASPPLYPPVDRNPYHNTIVPSCFPGPTPPPPGSVVDDLVKRVCVDGHPIQDDYVQFDEGGPGVPRMNFLSLSLSLVNATTTYIDGPTVCEPKAPWDGKSIIAADCKIAIAKLRSSCFKQSNNFLGGSYAYNCVNYSWKTDPWGPN